MSNKPQELPERQTKYVEQEIKDKYLNIVIGISYIISIYDNINVDMENIKETILFSSLSNIKDNILNTIKCDRLNNDKDKVFTLIEILWNTHEQLEEFIKQYEIIFVKNSNSSDKIMCDSNTLDYIRSYFKNNSLYLQPSITKYLEIFLKEIKDLKGEIETKRDYYKNGKNNKIYYYTLGYFSWIYNGSRYKTMYNNYENFLCINIQRLINDIKIAINKNDTILNALKLMRDKNSECILKVTNYNCNQLETEIGFLRRIYESNIITINSLLK